MQSRQVTRWVSLLLFAVLLPAVHVAAQSGSEPDSLTFATEVGFDGYYKPGGWVPVRVAVSNNGPDLEGLIIVEQSGGSPGETARYQAPIGLPGQSRKTVTLFVGAGTYQQHMTVSLTAAGRTLAEERVPITQVGTQEHLYAVVSGEPVDMTALEQATGVTSYVAYLTLDQLPAAGPAWDALDLLVLNNVDTAALEPAQLKALQGWLAIGGHLIVTGGPNWRKTFAGLGDLLPVSVAGSISSPDLSALSELTGSAVGDGPFVVAQGTLRDGRMLLAQDDLLLLVRRREGLGQVDWLALDLALAPLRDWSGNDRLWGALLAAPDRVPWDHSNIDVWAAREGLANIPSLTLPSSLQMVAFLLVYTAIVGPINYLFLKRLQRRELAWLTIPIIILLFGGLAYFTGFQLRGGNVVLNRLSLVHGAAGADSARARTLLGLFSPNRATYDVSFPEGTLVRTLAGDVRGVPSSTASATFEQSGGTILRDVQVDVAGLRAFRVESDIHPPAVESGFTIDTVGAPRLEGKVTNRADFVLQSAGLWIGDTIVELGDLAPGQTVSVNTLLGGGRATPAVEPAGGGGAPSVSYAPPFSHLQIDKLIGGMDYWQDRQLNRRYQMLQAFLSSGEASILSRQSVIFFGWSEESIWPMEVVGAGSETLDTVGYFLELPLSLSASQTSSVVPPALTTWQSLGVARPGEIGPYDFYLTNDWIGFQFQPWGAFQLAQVDELRLNIDANQSQGAIRVALWDWSSESWSVDESLGWGQNLIRRPGALVGPNNAVRVRVENLAGIGISIRRIDVEFRGTAQ